MVVILSQPQCVNGVCRFGKCESLRHTVSYDCVIADDITLNDTTKITRHQTITTEIAWFMGPTWGPPGSCWPQMGPMLAPWTLLSRKKQQNMNHAHNSCFFYDWPWILSWKIYITIKLDITSHVLASYIILCTYQKFMVFVLLHFVCGLVLVEFTHIF